MTSIRVMLPPAVPTTKILTVGGRDSAQINKNLLDHMNFKRDYLSEIF